MMGGNVSDTSEKPVGVFYLETNVNPPYAKARVDDFESVELVKYTDW